MIAALKFWQVGAGVVLGALLAAGPVYLAGKSAGRSDAATASLETSVQILRERGKIDAQVNASDASALCRDLGLLGVELAECVRRLEQVAAQP